MISISKKELDEVTRSISRKRVEDEAVYFDDALRQMCQWTPPRTNGEKIVKAPSPDTIVMLLPTSGNETAKKAVSAKREG